MTDDYYILRLPEVLKARGRSKPSHYEDIQKGLFTHPVLLGGRSVGWPEAEVRAINQARIAGKTEEQIRDLVAQLETLRRAAS
jgi:prophage regulatory protein